MSNEWPIEMAPSVKHNHWPKCEFTLCRSKIQFYNGKAILRGRKGCHVKILLLQMGFLGSHSQSRSLYFVNMVNHILSEKVKQKFFCEIHCFINYKTVEMQCIMPQLRSLILTWHQSPFVGEDQGRIHPISEESRNDLNILKLSWQCLESYNILIY